MKNLRLVLLVLVVFVSANIAQNVKISSKINKILKSEILKDASIGIDIFNLTKNKPIFSFNNQKLFVPASNQKIITSATAINFLPQNYEFSTKFRTNGVIIDSVVFGDLIIKSDGNPNFGKEEFQSTAENLKKMGIKKIKGNLVADISWNDSVYWGKGWMWDDNPSEYLPYYSSLNSYLGKMKVVVQSGSFGEQVKVTCEPKFESVIIQNNATISISDTNTLFVTRVFEENRNKIIIYGKIPQNSVDDFEFNIENPEQIFLEIMKNKLISNSIEIEKELKIEENVQFIADLFEIKTPIEYVLNRLNKKSDNLYAEILVRAIGVYHFSEPARFWKSKILIDSLITLTGNKPENFTIADGSGLSRYNLISPKLIIDIFKFLYKNDREKFHLLINSFAVSGEIGTLKNRLNSKKNIGKVKAKTGSLTSVNSLSGVLTNSYGDEIAFSVIVNNYSRKDSDIRKLQDSICEILIKGK